MEILFKLMFAANLAVTLVSLVVMPSRIAVHFGPDGTANAWGSSAQFALLTTCVHVLLFFAFQFSSRMIFLFPPRLINLPHKEYWLSPENRAGAAKRIDGFMWRLGSAMFAFFLVLGLLTLKANMEEGMIRLDLTVFLCALALLLLYTVWWVISFYRGFRPPPSVS